MADKTDVTKIKLMRTKILGNLNILYPSPIQLISLYRTVCQFDPVYSRLLFSKDIIYLQDKGYIEFIDEVLGGSDELMAKVCRLTADGKEVAEGTDTDPALEI